MPKANITEDALIIDDCIMVCTFLLRWSEVNKPKPAAPGEDPYRIPRDWADVPNVKEYNPTDYEGCWWVEGDF